MIWATEGLLPYMVADPAETKSHHQDPLGLERGLVRQAKDGDATAFAEIYDANVVRVYRHIYYLVGNTPDAEDLTAQSFLNAWAAISRYEDRGRPILNWLLRIAHRQAISWLKSRRP